MKKLLRVAAVAAAAALALTACGGGGSTADPANVSPTGEIKPREISWLLSRPADGAVINIMKKLADDYAKDHPGFALNLITTPDRPSYIQKLETLAAANKLPELFDTDATPFAQQLAKQGKMVDADKLLKSLNLYDDYRPGALDYQRFDDGSLYMIPFQFELEFMWYNKALLEKAGVSIPKSLDDIPAMCTALRKAGITPIAIDGQDQWPLERYVAYQPFREAGPDFVQKLKKGESSFSDAPGQKTVKWMADLGKANCFQDGFSSQGYSDAQNQFTSGQAAMYNIGTWELPSLATDKLNPAVRDNIDFFTLPTTEGSVTAANEFVSPSGIGMAVNSKTYDPLVSDFLKFALEKYPSEYAATGALSPTTNVQTAIPANATPLYKKALETANDLGDKQAMPWDTQLDPTTNGRLQQELVLLVQGNITPEQFTSTMNDAIKQNAPKFFK
ncbi:MULTISPECIES: extracellular solute-binding protein [Paenarthrobacter]|jgi:raffinose/stachyose/melibiose transport system substrate-binding protein|uniref:ABC transporter substrate-binding protein n=1 Tax=Paenarthrobacter TaxID=1742992 RepID=UPI00035DF9CF|nr:MULTISPECIES: extracellular solute-binding protein [Paenarthrobacter]KIA74448.1 extracellular sugar-binding protein [Arthrobacter sp. MWB30]KQR02123.1 sugar-binding protein [Arthrobacter sp. Leaf145]MBP2393730.1 raffinose/stachyose/melibiose transport system substrate-binding protein [Paenarthrobacter nicotinovorans]UKF00025.1 extracellular solute-binding protein [Paenarthrobacter nicotinovorans]UKF04807.1 extracellular solute-binding protein [Paenarthrobacter nicotinovorans]